MKWLRKHSFIVETNGVQSEEFSSWVQSEGLRPPIPADLHLFKEWRQHQNHLVLHSNHDWASVKMTTVLRAPQRLPEHGPLWSEPRNTGLYFITVPTLWMRRQRLEHGQWAEPETEVRGQSSWGPRGGWEALSLPSLGRQPLPPGTGGLDSS